MPLRSALSDVRLFAPFATASAQQPPAPVRPPAPVAPPTPFTPPTVARRRGTKVGYIDDATIEGKVRVRFDAASENKTPDRAEFFYAKCGCYAGLGDPNNPAHALFDPDAPGPEPGTANDISFRQLDIWGEYAFNKMVSVFVQLPLRWLEPKSFVQDGEPGFVGFSDQSGLSDLRAGAKFGFEPAVNHTLTAQAQFFFPTGDASKGLGTDHASVEPSLLYFQKFPNTSDRFALEGQFGFWLPIGGSDGSIPANDDGFAGNVLAYGIGPSYVVYDGNGVRIAPVVELVGWRVLSGFKTPPDADTDVSGTNIVNLKYGARFTFQGRNSLYVGYGHALTDESWYDDIVRIEYRYSF
jgi:hypothetical protein